MICDYCKKEIKYYLGPPLNKNVTADLTTDIALRVFEHLNSCGAE